MDNNQVTIIQPAFYKSFICTGPLCTDNCCHSWEIIIDKKHYHNYIKEQNPEFRTLCLKTVKRLADNSTPEHYAVLKLNEDGLCGFQDSDGGCRVYRLLGPDSLSCTCALYPRRKAQFLPDVWELSLSLSCEEAARTALFSSGSMELEYEVRTICKDDMMDAAKPLGIGRDGQFVPPPVWGQALRQTCMELISFPGCSIQERILSIGLLLHKADQLLAGNQANIIPGMAAQFLTAVRRGDFAGFFGMLDYHREAHLAAFRLPVAHLLAAARKPVLKHLWNILKPWCDIDPTGGYLAGERATSFLLREIKQKADPFVNGHAKAIEHYFTCYMFSGLFPFLYYNKGLSLEKHGIMLAEQFALLRVLIAVYHDIPEDEDRLVKAAVTLSRLCQHTDLGQDMEQLTRSIRLDGLAHAAYLLR